MGSREWYRQVQFVSAVPMPAPVAEELGTTVNGMWADPERGADGVDRAHAQGQRVLFSVPMIALTPHVYETAADARLLDEVCGDISGGRSECDWYYWEDKPVYAACIYSDAFRGYLLDRCKAGVDRGMDVVNLDEIMTSVGLMNRNPRGCGFCARCLDRFRTHGRPEIAATDDELRAQLQTDDDLYERYRSFHAQQAFEVMIGFIAELRAYADEHNPAFAISANVAYLGNLVPTFGPLWGCMWGRHVDFVLMENHYRVEHSSPHLLLPRAKFTAWYRLASALTGSPVWICPSITVPRQLEGSRRTTYYLLMFCEAYANAGRWGYYWWPGVDVETRLAATVPAELGSYISFIGEHRELYEDAVPANELAIVYADSAISQRPDTHLNYLALAQALAEHGYQFDVVYAADGRFNPDDLSAEALGRYQVILLPEARELGMQSAAAIEAFARAGGEVVVYSDSPLDPGLVRRGDGEALAEFWRGYCDTDRDRIVTDVPVPSSVRTEASHADVGVIRYVIGGRQVLHLINYGYEETDDTVRPVRDLRLRIPPGSTSPGSCTLLAPGRTEQPVDFGGDNGCVVVEVPRLDTYALLVVEPVS